MACPWASRTTSPSPATGTTTASSTTRTCPGSRSMTSLRGPSRPCKRLAPSSSASCACTRWGQTPTGSTYGNPLPGFPPFPPSHHVLPHSGMAAETDRTPSPQVAQGTPTNHLNNAYYPGGSSSGPASAVSAGLIPIAVGTDAGGSVRIPATFNGIYGLKTSQHRTVFMNHTMCITGPIAATVADLTIAYRVMSQPNPDCATQGRFALSLPPAPSAKKTMGVYRDWWRHADPRVAAACDAAVDWLAAERGYEVIDISIPYLVEAQLAHGTICIAEMAEHLRRRAGGDPANWLSLVGPANRITLSVARQTPAGDYLKYNALRTLLMRHLAFLFQKHPGLLIVTPVTPLVGWPRVPGDESRGLNDANTTLRSMMYIFLANMTGTPSLSAPVGYVEPDQGEGKLSVGLLATGEWGSEEQLLSWAAETEEYLHDVYEGGRRKPDAWLDAINVAKASKD
ncbi:Amidase [Purpureocillium takamizusanense]|uniref:Amidase n=1 Tax=Purpureocillium takamizusanense TaxID=2060973 RepID=A0A9Q8VF89_9HYPO|nr:Amidase [Purpureocillium takamizusanense]UNI23403.1 Amidase [Purpureocillium takamizusanense]